MGDIFTLCGLLVSLIGAGVTANAVILQQDDAIEIGLSRLGGSAREENLRLPMVRNLLWSSRAAMWGLTMVAGGIALQSVPIIERLVGMGSGQLN